MKGTFTLLPSFHNRIDRAISETVAAMQTIILIYFKRLFCTVNALLRTHRKAFTAADTAISITQVTGSPLLSLNVYPHILF